MIMNLNFTVGLIPINSSAANNSYIDNLSQQFHNDFRTVNGVAGYQFLQINFGNVLNLNDGNQNTRFTLTSNLCNIQPPLICSTTLSVVGDASVCSNLFVKGSNVTTLIDNLNTSVNNALTVSNLASYLNSNAYVIYNQLQAANIANLNSWISQYISQNGINISAQILTSNTLQGGVINATSDLRIGNVSVNGLFQPVGNYITTLTTLNNYLPTVSFNNTIGNYLLNSSFINTVSSYLPINNFLTTISSYLPINNFNNTISSYLPTQSFHNTISNYLLNSAFNTYIAQYGFMTFGNKHINITDKLNMFKANNYLISYYKNNI